VKDYLRQLIADRPDNVLKRSVAREYLQARILQSLQESSAFLGWAFLGGTALRLLYHMPRYSEDLDFSVVGPAEDLRFSTVLRNIRSLFEGEGYTVAVRSDERKTVISAFVSFDGLLHELGISPHRSEVLSVKLEVDTNPPQGAVTATTIIRRYVTLNVLHYDRPSLLAGKIHAVLSRRYVKGRDLYDLAWYMADQSWPPPNFSLLNAALQQTEWQGPMLTSDNWRDTLAARLEAISWRDAAEDVGPFLERANDAVLITRENCLRLIRRRSSQ